VLIEAVLHLDRGHVLPSRDDHVLLAIRDHQVLPVEVATVAGVEPSPFERRGRLVGLLPVPGKDVVGAGEDFTFVIDGDLHSDGGRAGPAQPL
jgi:hypothetical protein